MKLGVVGTGSIGRRHIGNLLALGFRDVVAVSEHSRRSSLEIDGTPVPVLHDYDDLLNSEGLDAIVIANPTSLHLDYTTRAVAAGKHVYLEKPAAASATGVAEVADEAERRKLVIAMGTQYRFNDRLLELRRRIADGEVGLILSVDAHLGEHIADYHPGEDYRQSYTARSDLGGGVLLTQIHQIDYLNWIFGPFERVFAVGGRRTTLDIDVEDTVSYLMQSANGTAVHGHLNYLERPKRVDLRVTGDRGTFFWDYFSNALTYVPATLDAEPVISRSPFDRNAMFLAAMTDFIDAIRNRTAPGATLTDGLDALHVVDAIKASMRTGTAADILSSRSQENTLATVGRSLKLEAAQ